MAKKWCVEAEERSLRKMLIRYLAIVFLIFCVASPSGLAATFDVKPKSGNSSAVVIVIGDFELGDEKNFIQAVLPLDNAVVVLTSNGGDLYAGIEIGRAIRLKSLSTFVPHDSVCASACAIAWLAGDHRYVDGNGQVGFRMPPLPRMPEGRYPVEWPMRWLALILASLVFLSLQ